MLVTEYDCTSINSGKLPNTELSCSTSANHSASGGLGLAASSNEVSITITDLALFNMCRKWCLPCRILMSEFVSPSFILVALSNHGTFLGFMDQDSESNPARITRFADCPNAISGEQITTFWHSILVGSISSLSTISLTSSIKFRLLSIIKPSVSINRSLLSNASTAFRQLL